MEEHVGLGHHLRIRNLNQSVSKYHCIVSSALIFYTNFQGRVVSPVLARRELDFWAGFGVSDAHLRAYEKHQMDQSHEVTL
jgi:hypothetical protein